MAMAYGPLMVGMICRNSTAVSAKIEEGLHAHTGNVLKNMSNFLMLLTVLGQQLLPETIMSWRRK